MDYSVHERHIPVLPEQVLQVLAPQKGESYIDATAGFGGHAELILRATHNGPATLIDQDAAATSALQSKFGARSNLVIKHSNFARIDWLLMPPADMILFDLGVSSVQLNEAERGFSFRADGPLDMRMDQGGNMSAAQLVNELAEDNLADMIWRYGEENQSRKIARAIVAARPIETTTALAQAIHQVLGKGKRIDSATKTFQALRIAVNRELEVLKDTLPKAAAALKPGGRLAVISFHSLEDRIVKQCFRSLTAAEIDPITGQTTSQPSFVSVTKKPLIASAAEIDSNPRARSAKLRAVEKQN